MKLGLNGSTTDQCNLKEDIIVAERAGFDIVEPRTYKINTFLENDSLEELAKVYRGSSVSPFAINAIEFFSLKDTQTEKDKVLRNTEYWCKIANAIGCPYVIAVPSQLKENVTESYIINNAVEMLKQMSDIASRFNVGLALEFIGFETFSVRTLSLADHIVKKVNRDNVGLVIDAYHFYIGGSTIESINQIDREKVFIFHINDAENLPKEQLVEANRIFPGLGVIPLADIGEALTSIGFDRMGSLELFRPEYWKMEKQRLADQAYHYVKEATDSMFKNKAH